MSSTGGGCESSRSRAARKPLKLLLLLHQESVLRRIGEGTVGLDIPQSVALGVFGHRLM